jgi:hypothetical protein
VIDEAFARKVLARCVLFSRLDPASLDACLGEPTDLDRLLAEARR